MTVRSFIAALIFVMSMILFVLMGIDKSRAIRGKWRISERTLFAFALLGGAPGGLTAMLSFRHKTKHRYFLIGFSLLAAVQLGMLIYLSLREHFPV